MSCSRSDLGLNMSDINGTGIHRFVSSVLGLTTKLIELMQIGTPADVGVWLSPLGWKKTMRGRIPGPNTLTRKPYISHSRALLTTQSSLLF